MSDYKPYVKIEFQNNTNPDLFLDWFESNGFESFKNFHNNMKPFDPKIINMEIDFDDINEKPRHIIKVE